MRGAENPRWRGGRSVHPNGYVYLSVGGGRSQIPEHRLVMEQELGRPLTDDESVHHKSGVRSDNRIENLDLRSSYHPQGQTPAELMAWAHEILERYAQD